MVKQLPKQKLSDFLNFIREQGVVGLAVGFILGGSVSKVVTALVNDIINPVLSVLLGFAGDIGGAKLMIGPIVITYGHFIVTLLDFVVIAAVVYFVIKGIGIDKLDKKKE